MRRRQVAALVGTGISLTLTGCSSLVSEITSPTPSGTAKAAVTKSKLTKELSGDGTWQYLSGQVTNTGEVRLSDPTVTIKFQDENGFIRDSTSERIYSLKPGQHWDFWEPYVRIARRAPPPAAKATIEIDEFERVENYTHPSGLDVSDVTLKPREPVTVHGDITNTTGQMINVYATAQFLTEQNHVLGWDSKFRSSLGAGKTWRFAVDWYESSEKPIKKTSGYELFLEYFSSH